MTLLGIIRSPAGGSAVVLDEVDHTSLSLRLGDNRRGWVVRSIATSSVTLENQTESATVTFAPPPSQAQPPASALAPNE